MGESKSEVCEKLLKALNLRKKYRLPSVQQGTNGGGPLEFSFGADGLVSVRRKGSKKRLLDVPSLNEYYEDMDTLFHVRSAGPVSSYCYQRLRLLQTKFELYSMVSGDAECREAMETGHRDFYNVRKVDTHIHHSAAMNAKHLLRFMKKKIKTFSSDVVDVQNGKERTLGDVFEAMATKWTDMSIDSLQVWADKSCLHRFDRFNNKYSPMAQNDLRTIFLKTDNGMGGRYLAELTRELLVDLEEAKYQHVEWRLSIYGRKMSEWDALSCWVLGLGGKGLGNGQALLSPQLGWMIQIPRLFSLYKTSGQLDNFSQMLENIFTPMFEATLDPEAHPRIAKFLENVSGFDTVDDESKSQNPVDRTFSSKARTPKEWDLHDNPSYKYYSFFIQSNLSILNQLRQMRGMNTFHYRPHAGEAGEVHHLDTAFLLADGINHGLNLRKSPALQYLFYLDQIGLAMSPCSNNQLFLAYEKSPFPIYFSRGLNVSLSTDDPLMFHQTKEPLMEEYSIAKQLWHFSAVDLCEMARNSVIQSGFSDATKAAWLGTPAFLTENMPNSTNVPNLRHLFRKQALKEEWLNVRGEAETGDDVGVMCNLLLLSPESRRLSMLGVQKEPTTYTLPRVQTMPGEEGGLIPFEGSIMEKEDDVAEEAIDFGFQRSLPQVVSLASLARERERSRTGSGLPDVSDGGSHRRKNELLPASMPSQVYMAAAVGLAALLGSLGGALLGVALLGGGRRRA